MLYLCQSLTSELYSILLITFPVLQTFNILQLVTFGGLAELENLWVLFSKW